MGSGENEVQRLNNSVMPVFFVCFFCCCTRLKALMATDYFLMRISFYTGAHADKLLCQLITTNSENYLAESNYPFFKLFCNLDLQGPLIRLLVFSLVCCVSVSFFGIQRQHIATELGVLSPGTHTVRKNKNPGVWRGVAPCSVFQHERQLNDPSSKYLSSI